MKCSEFKMLLERGIAFRSPAFGAEDETWARDLFPALDLSRNQSVRNLAKGISLVTPIGGAEGSPVAHLCAFLGALALLLANQAKTSTVQEIRELELALRPHAQSSLKVLVGELFKSKTAKASKPNQTAPIRDDVVARYSRRLEEALGDDEGFNSVFAALEGDNELSAGEITAIAKKFANSAAKARSAALKKIFARHQAIMIGRAKSAATAGRIAG